MSGHNKWSTIKNKKAKTDAAKGKIFTKIGRAIVIAVKTGGSADPALNSKLKDVIAKAKAANMPNDNIQRSIKKAAGEGESANYKEVTYEGYAPCGVAVIVEIVTDNLNRTASEVRHIFDKCGGSLGASGCVSWKFERKGVIEIDNSKGMDEDELTMLAPCGVAMTSFSLLCSAGAALPPAFTAMTISRPILVKILPFAASVLAFLFLMVDHLLCPDMDNPSQFRLNIS